jgi:hypothetical protein
MRLYQVLMLTWKGSEWWWLANGAQGVNSFSLSTVEWPSPGNTLNFCSSASCACCCWIFRSFLGWLLEVCSTRPSTPRGRVFNIDHSKCSGATPCSADISAMTLGAKLFSPASAFCSSAAKEGPMIFVAYSWIASVARPSLSAESPVNITRGARLLEYDLDSSDICLSQEPGSGATPKSGSSTWGTYPGSES